ncbi:MAG: flagella basal body P-ring formation protein FlgA [Sphingomonadales bacterium]|nr:flagella basal body P-ring formation protein FlgA [Sphingomonadales bacterium]MDE2169723.1 flagella basal body P-ring formation protein FlgA [Sphingomonadales bacterium]
MRKIAPFFALLLASPALAQGAFTDPAAIDAAVADFTGHAIGSTGGAAMPVDRRLRMTTCRSPLSVSWRGVRRDSVIVECPDPGSWHLYVNVRSAPQASAAVQRGEAVAIVVSGDGFAVSQPGEAMDNGAVGDWIRVRSVRDGTAKGEPIRARITRPGEVTVPLDE